MRDEPYFEIEIDSDLRHHIRREREKARALKKTRWWQQKLQQGQCYYCGQPFPPDQLSMDHRVPLARGGRSTKGNIVPACIQCNRQKNLETPAEVILR
ncbi:MAG: HNH endonuclease, partial [Nitrospirae bacterium]